MNLEPLPSWERVHIPSQSTVLSRWFFRFSRLVGYVSLFPNGGYQLNWNLEKLDAGALRFKDVVFLGREIDDLLVKRKINTEKNARWNTFREEGGHFLLGGNGKRGPFLNPDPKAPSSS